MKTRERILIYGAMMLLVAMNIAVLSGVRGQSAWADNPAADLYGGTGLPAPPFRTDDWPGVTDGRR